MHGFLSYSYFRFIWYYFADGKLYWGRLTSSLAIF